EYLFPSHPWKTNGTGAIASADAVLDERWVLGAAYRFVRFGTSDASTVTVAPFNQNEGYVDAGYAGASFGLILRGAVVGDGTGALGTSTHAGLSLRWSPLGDALLDASLSEYKDGAVARVAPRWRVPIAGPLSIVPGGFVQAASGGPFGGATLAAVVATKR